MHPAYMVPKLRTGKELSPAANTAAARADEKGWAPENMPPPTPTRRGAGPEYYGGLPGPSSWWLDVNANRDTEYAANWEPGKRTVHFACVKRPAPDTLSYR